MAEAKRYDWADFARGLLMVLVFIYHSEVYYYHEHTYSWVFIPFFLTGFFFISGFLFTRDISSISLEGKIKQVVRGIVFPYLVFEMLLSMPKFIIGRTEIGQFFIDFFLFRGIWFVVAIGVMQIIYALLLRKRPSIKKLLLGTLCFFVLGLLLCWIYDGSCPLHNLVTSNPILFSPELPNRLPFCLNLALFFSPFFALGIICRMYEDKFLELCGRKWLIVSTALYIVVYCIIDHRFIGSLWNGATGVYHNLPLMMLYAFLGIWMIICISNSIKSVSMVNYIGKYSILFLFMNGGALTIVTIVLSKMPFLDSSNYINQLFAALIALLIVYVASLCINRFMPILRGDKEAFNRVSQRLGLKIKW